MHSEGTRNRLWLIGASLLLGVVFIADLKFPLGVISGPLYVLVSLCALRDSARSAIVLATIATIANVIAYGISPTVGIPEWMVGANRMLAVCTTWLLIVFSIEFHRAALAVIAQMEEKEARLRLASEAADLGYWSNDLSTGEITFDERWVNMLGYRAVEVENSASWYDGLVHPEDRTGVELAWRKHLSGQTDRFEVEHRLRTKNGSWRRILSKGRVIARDAAGTPLRAAGTHLDVTLTRELERQAEQALRERYHELQLVTDRIPMIIAYLDTKERLQFNNRACGLVFDTSSDAMQGICIGELLGSPAYLQLQPYIAAALQGKTVQFEEVVQLRSDSYWWLVHLLPQRDDHGTVLGFFMLATDVTGIKATAAEVDRQREAIALHTNRGVANEMAAAIAHELNQPLATISIYASELVRSYRTSHEEPVELERALDLIDQECRRAGQIMRRVRELVDNRKPKSTAYDLSELFESVRQICDFRARAAGVKIELNIEEGANSIYADPVQLQQVLVNLINNAVDASADAPQERKHIALRAATEATGTHLQVVDQGHGLSQNHLKRIFTPYFTTKPNGLGIGLNICQSIVAAHGGKLWATANDAQGATFHVLLPTMVTLEASPPVLCKVS